MNRRTRSHLTITAIALGCSLAGVSGAHAQTATPDHGGARLRVAVAARDLARGSVLSASDIRWADTTGVTRSRTDTADVAAGWVARRSIHTGEVLRAPAVTLPDLVSSGDPVDVIYSAPGISIRVRGTAIGSGSQGEQVYVKLDNRKRLRGVVAGASTVRVM